MDSTVAIGGLIAFVVILALKLTHRAHSGR
jgi:hypothetical protein